LIGTKIFHFLNQTEEASGTVLTILFQTPYVTQLVMYQKQNITNTLANVSGFGDYYLKNKIEMYHYYLKKHF
jgi:hypothetical protein